MWRLQNQAAFLGPGTRPVPGLRSGAQGVKLWVGVGSGVPPPSLPHSVITTESTRLALKELSLPAICKTGAAEGEEGEAEGVEKKGEADCRETASGTPSPGSWPLGPQPQKRPCPPRGRSLSPRPAPALQLCVPRRVGCRISSQALAACSVFPNPPVGEGGSPVRIRVPPPCPSRPPLSASLSCPRTFSKLLPIPTLAPAPPSTSSIGSQVASSGWKGPGGPTILKGAYEATLLRPTLRPAGHRLCFSPLGARPIPGPGPGVSHSETEAFLGGAGRTRQQALCGRCQALGQASRRGQCSERWHGSVQQVYYIIITIYQEARQLE